MAAALICILGIWIFYPLVMRLGFSQELIVDPDLTLYAALSVRRPGRQSADRYRAYLLVLNAIFYAFR